jgi:hypothetical protein
VGKLFGPIMALWFVSIAGLGVIREFPLEFAGPLPHKMDCWKDPGHEVGAFLALAASTADS